MRRDVEQQTMKIQIKLKIWCLLALAVIAISVTGCIGLKSSHTLVGRWKSEARDGQSIATGHDYLVFNQDGTCQVIVLLKGSRGAEHRGHYIVTNGILTVTSDEGNFFHPPCWEARVSVQRKRLDLEFLPPRTGTATYRRLSPEPKVTGTQESASGAASPRY